MAALALQLVEKHSDGFETILCQNVIGTDLKYVNNQLDKKSMLEWARCSSQLIILLKHGESSQDLACTKGFQVIQYGQSVFYKKEFDDGGGWMQMTSTLLNLPDRRYYFIQETGEFKAKCELNYKQQMEVSYSLKASNQEENKRVDTLWAGIE